MKRFKIKMHLSIGYQGGHDDEDTFDMPDDATPEDIENEAETIAKGWADNHIDLWYAYELIETAPGTDTGEK